MATARFIQDGDAIDYRPANDVAAGDVVQFGNLIGIAKRDIPANTLGSLAMTGVFEFPKAEQAIYEFGNSAFWDYDQQGVREDSDGGQYVLLGLVAEASGATNPVVKVRLA